MAKRRDRTGATVSLFPFLSILACIMGALTLILAGVVIGQVEGAAGGEQELKRVTREISTTRENLTPLGPELDKAVAENRMISERVKQVTPIDLPYSPEETETIVARWKEKTALEKEVKDLQDRNDELQRQLRQTQSKINEIKGGILRLVLESSRDGAGKELHPVYVECTADGLVLYAEHKEKKRISISELRTCLEEAMSDSSACVEFLIRPGGVGTFKEMRSSVNLQHGKYGYMALPGHGEIEF